MAQGTQSPKKIRDGRVIRPNSEGPKGAPQKVASNSEPGSRPSSHGQSNHSRRERKATPALELSDWQHAQVTRATFEQEQLGAAIAGKDGRIQRANRALANLLQYSPEELVGITLTSLVREPDHAYNPRPKTPSLAGKTRGLPAVNYLVRKSGDTIACLVNSHTIHDEQGKVTHFMVFVSDARSTQSAEERTRFENELCRAQAVHTLGMLAGGVAHDFNNVLEVILGFASLARVRLPPKDPMHEPLKIIEESAKGGAGLARQLLDVSQDSEDSDEQVDINDLISSTLSIVTSTFDRKIRIEHRICSELPPVRGNRRRLEQALLNLCLNARDAMEQGGTLTIEASEQEIKPGDKQRPESNAAGPYVRIIVRDTGEGMPADIQEKIFVPRFTTKAKGRGYGLGLAMVNQIVKEARGFVSVSSRPRRGSEFSLYLPAVLDSQPRETSSGTSEIIPGTDGVLVVDDEPRVLEFLARGLRQLGYKVITAENGSKACRIYSSRGDEIDCVLLDLIMPGMGGLEVYARLKDINPGVRVILSSGYSSGRFKTEALESGCLKFLEKPYTLEELSQAMQKIRQN